MTLQQNTHYQPHKSCGCRACRRGRNTKWGKHALHHAEKILRHHARVGLRLDPYNYENALAPTKYTD